MCAGGAVRGGARLVLQLVPLPGARTVLRCAPPTPFLRRHQGAAAVPGVETRAHVMCVLCEVAHAWCDALMRGHRRMFCVCCAIVNAWSNALTSLHV